MSRPHAPFSSTLYVIDKTAKTYVSSDDIIAANSTAFSDDLRPTISKGKCERD